MIKVEDVHKSFGEEEILKGITTEFDKGKTNLIIGQSGSGKTVLLKCLLGTPGIPNLRPRSPLHALRRHHLHSPNRSAGVGIASRKAS